MISLKFNLIGINVYYRIMVLVMVLILSKSSPSRLLFIIDDSLHKSKDIIGSLTILLTVVIWSNVINREYWYSWVLAEIFQASLYADFD